MATEGAAAFETKGEAAGGYPVRRWIAELDLADKQEKAWRESGLKAIERYRDEKDRDEAKFNILYSNVQTLAPALYTKTPNPDIRRRYRDADLLGKEIAEVLERASSYTLDMQDFDSVMNAAVWDVLLPGRCVTRIRYIPSFGASAPAEEGSEGEAALSSEPPVDTLAFEEIAFEHVDWQDFRRGPGRRWDEVPWIAFRHRLYKEQLVELAGEEVAADIPLDYSPDDTEERSDADSFKQATVWEIWCKNTGRVYWVHKGYSDGFLAEDEPDLDLQGFFPIPRPMYAVEDTGSLVPVDEYSIYRDQAEELDRITLRITRIIEVLKVRGVADSQIAELWNIESCEDGEFAPVENEKLLALLNDGRGLDNAIWMFPFERVVTVLRELYLQREQIKQTIYEIMGISDILRGSTKSSETATAQSIKAQWGSQRIQRRQAEVQRYARDLIRMAVEVMAEKFQPMTLSIMTGKEVTPEMMQIMSVDGLRSFRIDIETDSTIQADEESDKENITMLIQGITNYIQSVGPAVQEGLFPVEAAKAILLASVRRFKLGRDVEDALDQIGGQDDQPQSPEQGAEAQGQAIEAQRAQLDAQAKQAELQAKAQADMAKLQADMEQHRQEIDLKVSQFQAQLAEQQRQHNDKMALEWAKLGVSQDKIANQPQEIVT